MVENAETNSQSTNVTEKSEKGKFVFKRSNKEEIIANQLKQVLA